MSCFRAGESFDIVGDVPVAGLFGGACKLLDAFERAVDKACPGLWSAAFSWLCNCESLGSFVSKIAARYFCMSC